mgnify:CR=1 FL=1
MAGKVFAIGAFLVITLGIDKIKDNVRDHYKTFEAGEYLFRENDDSSAGLFLIKEGHVKVSPAFTLCRACSRGTNERQVYTSGCDSNQDMSTHYRATESLGAFDIIDRSNRCVSALAVTKTRVTVLSHRMFAGQGFKVWLLEIGNDVVALAVVGAILAAWQ